MTSILDQTRPPEEQLERLNGVVFKASLAPQIHYLRITWEPRGDPAGEFVVRVVRYSRDDSYGDLPDGRPAGGTILAERRCRTILDLKRIVGESEKEFERRAKETREKGSGRATVTEPDSTGR